MPFMIGPQRKLSTAKILDDRRPIVAETETKTRNVAKQIYKLVEIQEEDGGFVFVTLSIPEGTDCSGRTPIMRAVKAAISGGDDSYDDKLITVIAYPAPVLVKSEAVVVKRKVTFESVGD
jgi:hypothetical protein